jgi:hypothetical protein
MKLIMTFSPSLSQGKIFIEMIFKKRKEKINKCIKTGGLFDFEAVLVTANKRKKWVRAIGKSGS